jgi:hypothetical protein
MYQPCSVCSIQAITEEHISPSDATFYWCKKCDGSQFAQDLIVQELDNYFKLRNTKMLTNEEIERTMKAVESGDSQFKPQYVD